MWYLTGVRQPTQQLLSARTRLMAPLVSTKSFSSTPAKERNPMRMTSRQFVERELKENPEFFKAFPHLQSVFEEA